MSLNGQGLAAALRAFANATGIEAGRDSKTQKTPDLARAQRGRLQPCVRPPDGRLCFISHLICFYVIIWLPKKYFPHTCAIIEMWYVRSAGHNGPTKFIRYI